jgi:hypothetical protein
VRRPAPPQGFSGRSLGLLVGACVASFALGAGVAVFGAERLAPPSVQADAFSESAIGHRAFAEVLRAAGIPVVVSRHDSAGRLGRGSVLLLAEPRDLDEHPARREALSRAVATAGRALLVLPKWQATPSPGMAGWAGSVARVRGRSIDATLRAAGVEGEPTLATLGPAPAWETGPFRHAPTFRPGNVQLLASSEATVLLAHGEGALVLEAGDGESRLLVLADPDLLSNAGLHRGENAQLAVALVERLRDPGGAVVIDEVLHGHEVHPSLWRELLTPPLLYASLQAGLALLFLLWAGMGRFGRPDAAPPRLEPGTRALVGHTADLLQSGGHHDFALGRYLATTVRGLRRDLHVPADVAAIEPWLDRVGSWRGLTIGFSDLAAAARAGGLDPAERLRVAGRLHRWREEVVRGPGPSP